jgi:acid phosphatase family membrane protein YuiD
MNLSYVVTPMFSWLLAGALKFAINSIRIKRLAFGSNGNGGFPSSHIGIVSSTAALIGFNEGMDHPAFGVAFALAFIVALDAHGLRRYVGAQANAINKLSSHLPNHEPLRERMGHTYTEIGAGALVGIAVATGMHMIQ